MKKYLIVFGSLVAAAVFAYPPWAGFRQVQQPVSGGGGATVISTDGVDDKISFAGIDPTDDSYSVTMWIRPTALTESWETLLTAGGTGGFYLRSSGLLGFVTGGGSHFSSTPVTAGSWFHIAFINSSGAWTFYLNGVADGTGSGATTCGALNSMGDNSGSETFHGRIAQCAVFSVAITGTQVANLHNKSTTPAIIGNLLAWWKFDDVVNGVSGNGATFVDSSGNGNSGTGSHGANGTGLLGITADF